MEIADLSARDISGLTWRKSTTSFPDGQQCVEVAELGVGAIALRDSTNPPGRIINSLRRMGGLRRRNLWRRVVTTERMNLDEGDGS